MKSSAPAAFPGAVLILLLLVLCLAAVLGLAAVYAVGGLPLTLPALSPLPPDTALPSATRTPFQPDQRTHTPFPSRTATPTETPTPSQSPSPTPTASPTPLPQGQVQASVLNLRAGPGTQYESLLSLQRGMLVDLAGQYNQCEWIKIRVEGQQEGWVKGGDGFLTFPLACANLPSGTFRPLNGSLLADTRARTGMGFLSVQNQTSADALVFLNEDSSSPQLAFYVRSMETFDLSGVPNGSYQVFVARGTEWNGDARAFERLEETLRMQDKLVFKSAAGQASLWTLILRTLAGSTENALPISPAEFPPLP